MAISEKISELLDKLICDGDELLKKLTSSIYGFETIDDRQALRRWSNELILFTSLSGDLIGPWSKRLIHHDTSTEARPIEVSTCCP